jgi:hypothetical protein
MGLLAMRRYVAGGLSRSALSAIFLLLLIFGFQCQLLNKQ